MARGSNRHTYAYFPRIDSRFPAYLLDYHLRMIRKREIWCREFLPYSEMMMIARRRTMRPEITKTTPRRRRFRFSFFPSLPPPYPPPLHRLCSSSVTRSTLSRYSYTLIQLRGWWMANRSWLPRLFSLRPLTKRPRSSSLVSLLGDRSGLPTITSCSFFLVPSSSFLFFLFVVWRILSHDESRWIGFRSKGLKRFIRFLK